MDKTQGTGVSKVCNPSFANKLIIEEPGMKELLILYYYYMINKFDNYQDKLKFNQQFQMLSMGLTNISYDLSEQANNNDDNGKLNLSDLRGLQSNVDGMRERISNIDNQTDSIMELKSQISTLQESINRLSRQVDSREENNNEEGEEGEEEEEENNNEEGEEGEEEEEENNNEESEEGEEEEEENNNEEGEEEEEENNNEEGEEEEEEKVIMKKVKRKKKKTITKKVKRKKKIIMKKAKREKVYENENENENENKNESSINVDSSSLTNAMPSSSNSELTNPEYGFKPRKSPNQLGGGENDNDNLIRSIENNNLENNEEEDRQEEDIQEGDRQEEDIQEEDIQEGDRQEGELNIADSIDQFLSFVKSYNPVKSIDPKAMSIITKKLRLHSKNINPSEFQGFCEANYNNSIDGILIDVNDEKNGSFVGIYKEIKNNYLKNAESLLDILENEI